MATWVYLAASAQASAEETIRFAATQNAIYRPSRNVNGSLIANVGNLEPGDSILLAYRMAGRKQVRVCAKIALVDAPSPGTQAIRVVDGEFAQELFDAGYPPVDNDTAEIIPLEDVILCEFDLRGTYGGNNSIHALSPEDDGWEKKCSDKDACCQPVQTLKSCKVVSQR